MDGARPLPQHGTSPTTKSACFIHDIGNTAAVGVQPMQHPKYEIIEPWKGGRNVAVAIKS
jgi:hypothetical protein